MLARHLRGSSSIIRAVGMGWEPHRARTNGESIHMHRAYHVLRESAVYYHRLHNKSLARVPMRLGVYLICRWKSTSLGLVMEFQSSKIKVFLSFLFMGEFTQNATQGWVVYSGLPCPFLFLCYSSEVTVAFI
jgi:hypothetical protein